MDRLQEAGRTMDFEWLHRDTRGVPDRHSVDKKGNISSDLLLEHMGMNRAMRRMLAKDEKFGKTHFNREIRSCFFRDSILTLMAGNRKVPLEGDFHSSWEAQTFERFLPGWLSYTTELDAMLNADRLLSDEAITTWWESDNEFFGSAHKTPSQKKLPGNASDKLPEIFKLIIPVYRQLVANIDSWDSRTIDDKAVIADVCFAMFTLLGPAAVIPLWTKRPELLDAYKNVIHSNSTILNLPERKLPAIGTNITEPAQGPNSPVMGGVRTEPASMQEFYTSLIQLAEGGAKHPNDLSHADRVLEFVTANLPRLRHALSIDNDTLAEKLRIFADQVVMLGKLMAISLFDDAIFIDALTKAWNHFLLKALQAPMSSNYLNSLLTGLELSVASHQTKLAAARTLQKSAQETLSDAQRAKDTATFTTRRDAAAKFSQAEDAARKANENIIVVEDDAATDLLPDGFNVQTLEVFAVSGEVLPPDCHLVHPDSIPALLAFQSRVDGTALKATSTERGSANEEPAQIGPASADEDVVAENVSPQEDTPSPSSVAMEPAITELVAPIEIVDNPAPAATVLAPSAPETSCTQALAAETTVNDEFEPHHVCGQILDNAGELISKIQDTVSTDGMLPGALVDSAVLHWLANSNLPNALITLDLANSRDVNLQGDVIDRDLLQIAYTGRHVWPQHDASLGQIRVSLNFMSPQRIDEFLQRRQTKAVVPGLLFASSFQSAIFAGNDTAAPRVLASIQEMVDPQVERLIREVITISNRNIQFDLDGLRLIKPAEVEGEKIRELQTKLDDVVERVRHKQPDWAPGRKALSTCFELVEFRDAIEAVQKDNPEQASAVTGFLALYESEEARRELFEDQIRLADIATNGDIGRIPINAFHKTIQDLRDIFMAWLRLRNSRNDRKTDSVEYAQRLITLSRNAKAHLAAKRDQAGGIAQKANYALMHDTVAELLDVVDDVAHGTWEPLLAKAVLNLPHSILHLLWPSQDALDSLRHLTGMLVHPVDMIAVFDQAMATHDTVTAQVLIKTGAKLSNLEQRRHALLTLESQLRSETHKKLQLAEVLLDNALLAEIFDDEAESTRKQQMLDALKEEIDSRSVYEGLDDVRDEIEQIEREIENKLGRRVLDDDTKLKTLMTRVTELMGPEAVPVKWRERAEQALQSRMLPLISEMISQLEHSLSSRDKLPDIAMEHNADLDGFVAAQDTLYSAMAVHPNPREVWRSLTDLSSQGFDFSHARANTREVVDTLSLWYRDRKLHIGNAEIGRVRNILAFLGMVVPPAPYRVNRNDGPFRAMTVQVTRGDTGRGIPFFDGEPGLSGELNEVRIFIGVGDWVAKDLIECIEREAYGQRDILISPKVMDAAMREELANATKGRNRAIYHVDPVMAAYLGMINVAEDKVLKTWLRIAAPWTGFNPYHKGDTLMPATPEMRYGRLKQAYDLTRPRSNAVVSGGRQLGKTTILHEAVRLVLKNNDVAAYTRVDQTITLGPINETWEACRTWIFNEIHRLLFKAKLLPTPDALLNTDEEEKLIRQALSSPSNSKKMLLCLDEVDPLLELDSKKEFKLFRAIVNFVQIPNSPLKVVIAGLQNVKRFEQVPNVPLNQLGDSLQVSILETQDAIDLVQEPLAIAGYLFADPMLINHILVFTNRHPGLIQVYCAKLLDHLHKDGRLKVGSALITPDHLERVSKDKDVQERIQLRFDLTLNVDRRYLLIVYSLIAEGQLNGASTVTASRVLNVARQWAPQWFGNTSEGNIEAFLDEMIGLGILRNMGGRKYALRNPSILRLIGDRNKATDKLLHLVDMPAEDMLSAHRHSDENHLPSPLTLRDEQLLLKQLDMKGQSKDKKYSITVIVGSPALGLNPTSLRPALETLSASASDRKTDRPNVDMFKDVNLKNVSNLKDRLIESIGKRQARPSIFAVELSGQMPLAHTLALIDAALLARAEAPRLNHNIMVIFMMGPETMWQWRLHPELTADKQEYLNWIELARWSPTAIVRELEAIGLANTDEAVTHLQSISDGWYASIVDLIEEKRKAKHLDTATIQDIKNYQGIARATQLKTLNEFLSNSGVNISEAPWLKGLLTYVAGKKEFDLNDAGYYMLEQAAGFDDEGVHQTVMNWLICFGLVEAIVTSNNGTGETPDALSVRYKVTPAIANALRNTAQKA